MEFLSPSSVTLQVREQRHTWLFNARLYFGFPSVESLPDMPRRWVFMQHKDQPLLWTWRLLGADECIEQQGSESMPYGAAVTDAIRCGFRPTEEHWIVDTPREVTHHERGKKPLVVLKKDPRSFLPRLPVGPIKKSPAKSRLRLVGQK